MSHEHTVIEPAAGLTVLLGPNNCGKSAVVSALQTLAENTSGDFMIRHEEKEARVAVETDDGHVLCWRRKGATVSYLIDGKEIGRLKRDVPEDLHEHLKLPLVSSPGDGEEFDVHFAQQKTPIFLLDEAPSRPAMFFSASSDAGRLLEIQDLHREKVRDKKSRRRSLVAEIELTDVQLKKLEPLDEVLPLVESAEQEFVQLQLRARQARELEATIEQIDRNMRQAQQCATRAEALEPLQSAPPQDDCAAMTQLIDSLADLAMAAATLDSCCKVFGRLQAPPQEKDISPLSKMIELLEQVERRISDLHVCAVALDALLDAPELLDPAGLTQVVADVDAAEKTHFVCTQTLAQIDRQIAQVQKQVRAWATANPDCPLCGGAVSAEALLEGVHAHG